MVQWPYTGVKINGPCPPMLRKRVTIIFLLLLPITYIETCIEQFLLDSRIDFRVCFGFQLSCVLQLFWKQVQRFNQLKKALYFLTNQKPKGAQT